MVLYYEGFPPVIPNEEVSGDEPPAAVKDLLPAGPMKHLYWGYVNSWWPYRNDPNVIMLHYSNVRRDLKGHVAKIAKFLEVDLNKVELETVTERCSLEHMKKVDRFKYKMPLNQDKGLWDADEGFLIVSGALTNKGGVGTGESILDEENNTVLLKPTAILCFTCLNHLFFSLSCVCTNRCGRVQ